MNQHLVIPFKATLTQKDNANRAASQLQDVINLHTEDGWYFVSVENITTTVVGQNGCFGFGATPDRTVFLQMVVFKR